MHRVRDRLRLSRSFLILFFWSGPPSSVLFTLRLLLCYSFPQRLKSQCQYLHIKWQLVKDVVRDGKDLPNSCKWGVSWSSMQGLQWVSKERKKKRCHDSKLYVLSWMQKGKRKRKTFQRHIKSNYSHADSSGDYHGSKKGKLSLSRLTIVVSMMFRDR